MPKEVYIVKITQNSATKSKGFGQAYVEFDSTDVEAMIADYINENSEIIAKQIAKDAKANIHNVDHVLIKGVKATKSKFEDGGWIVKSTKPHSYIVEYGHGGPKPAPPHPFLRKALDSNIEAARAQFGAK